MFAHQISFVNHNTYLKCNLELDAERQTEREREE